MKNLSQRVFERKIVVMKNSIISFVSDQSKVPTDYKPLNDLKQMMLAARDFSKGNLNRDRVYSS